MPQFQSPLEATVCCFYGASTRPLRFFQRDADAVLRFWPHNRSCMKTRLGTWDLVYGHPLNQVERHIYLEKNTHANDYLMEQVYTIKMYSEANVVQKLNAQL